MLARVDQATDGAPSGVEQREQAQSAAAQSRGAEMAALVAELEQGAAESESAEQAPAKAVEAQEDAEDSPESSDAEAGDEQTEDAESDDDEHLADSDDKPDPELAKRLERLKKEESRSKANIKAQLDEAREQIAAERRKLEAEYAPKIEAARRYEDAAARAKYDPASVLMALGLTPEDLEPAAKQLYALSKAGSSDPRLRAAAQAELRQRQHEDELARTRKELDELRQQREQERAQAEQSRAVEQYTSSVVKAVDAAQAPLVSAMLGKAPEKTRSALIATAERLLAATGEVPEPADVIAALEQQRRAELEELDVDVATITKTKQKPVAAEKKTAKTLGAQPPPTKPPRETPRSRDEELAETIRLLESGQLE